MSFRLVPPSGTLISIGDLLRLMPAIGRSVEDIEASLRQRLGSEHCLLVSSGRAALFLSLKALQETAGPNKDEVIIPAYTCFSVAAAIARAGLRIRLVDIDPVNLDYDYSLLEKEDFSRVLAIIGCNLFGILNDWEKLHALRREMEVYLIDDAAQSLGSKYRGTDSGRLGDVGFYSLDRGKNLSVYSGGLLVTDSDLVAERIRSWLEAYLRPRLIENLAAYLKIATYAILARPTLYWLPAGLPFLGLGKTIFDESFVVGHLTKLQKQALAMFLPRLEKLNEMRTRNARKLAEPLLQTGKWQVCGYRNESSPIYLRLPVMAANRSTRDQAVTALRRLGIVASPMYPSTIRDIIGIGEYLTGPGNDFPGARIVVGRLLSLPTHGYVSARDIEVIVSRMERM